MAAPAEANVLNLSECKQVFHSFGINLNIRRQMCTMCMYATQATADNFWNPFVCLHMGDILLLVQCAATIRNEY